jgi:hypothetical protein
MTDRSHVRYICSISYHRNREFDPSLVQSHNLQHYAAFDHMYEIHRTRSLLVEIRRLNKQLVDTIGPNQADELMQGILDWLFPFFHSARSLLVYLLRIRQDRATSLLFLYVIQEMIAMSSCASNM